MATIKLQNGKVITKDGNVSCECCGDKQPCCPYDSFGLMINPPAYSFDDLPEEITGPKIVPSGVEFTDLIVPNSRCPTTIFRKQKGALPTGAPQAPIAENFINGEYFYIADSWVYNHPIGESWTIQPFIGREIGPAGIWRFSYYAIRPGLNAPVLVDSSNRSRCLTNVFENTPEGFYGCFGKDQFADTYTISYSYPGDEAGEIKTSTVIVNRISACRWTGVTECGGLATLYLLYVTIESNLKLKFRVLASIDPDFCVGVGRFVDLEKTLLQNTPAGEYLSFNSSYPSDTGIVS